MAILNPVSNVNYLEDDTGLNSRLSIFKYQRPRPGDKLLRQPLGLITLPLPSNLPSDQYSMDLSSAALGIVGNVTEMDASKGQSLTGLTNTIRERLGAGEGLAGTVGAGLVGILATAPGISDAGLGLNQIAQSLAGVVRNPHTALLFNSVHLRSFQFSWRLSPRSQDQSRKLNEIILTLKRAMHPNSALGGFAFDYPNLFTLNINNDKEGIVKVDYSFMRDLSINPVPNGHAYYRDGYPSMVDISFTLMEVKVKTAEDFGGGNQEAVDLIAGGGTP